MGLQQIAAAAAAAAASTYGSATYHFGTIDRVMCLQGLLSGFPNPRP